MTFELTLENFSGPLEKLLALIEEKKLEITEISLAEVTDDFLRYLGALEEVHTPLLADFIAVASRLLLIKSKSLLPELHLTEEEERGIRDLENRLRIYQELRPARKILMNLWRAKNWELSRPYFLIQPSFLGNERPFYPGIVKRESLKEAMERILKAFEKITHETKTIRGKIISLEEKIEEIIARVKKGSATFRKLAHRKSREEIIVIFLALLHLAREQLILLEQHAYFSDIMIKKM